MFILLWVALFTFGFTSLAFMRLFRLFFLSAQSWQIQDCLWGQNHPPVPVLGEKRSPWTAVDSKRSKGLNLVERIPAPVERTY